MNHLNLVEVRQHLQDFDFYHLFIALGWDHPKNKSLQNLSVFHDYESVDVEYREIAQFKGVAILEIKVDHFPEKPIRQKIAQELKALFAEHILIFINQNRTESLWIWQKFENKKTIWREHTYLKSQPGDLFISKISHMFIDFKEIQNKIGLIDVLNKLEKALDIEKITKKFYNDFQNEHLQFIDFIQGIDNEKDRKWYASVILNRLMFIYFLQKKAFINHQDVDYLDQKFKNCKNLNKNYYQDFLKFLFFEGFAKPKTERSSAVNELLGEIVYLNGGLFIPHQIEEQYPNISIENQAFENLLNLFGKYSWHLNDQSGANDNEINPDVLGYIFEKYINQKAFGAYYTRPEITQYLCEKTIYDAIATQLKDENLPHSEQFLINLNAQSCFTLLDKILPKLSILDPACGSGAFLVSAMKTLINIYSAIIGKAELLASQNSSLKIWLADTKKSHKNILYFIKKQIITQNLYGVDIMPEAVEIAKLRLFLDLVSSVETVDELEPLPNVDFNLLSGNSLIGLMHVDNQSFNKIKDMFIADYQQVLDEKNRLISLYKNTTDYTKNLADLKNKIQERKKHDYHVLNQILAKQFSDLKIKFEQSTWNFTKNKEGKPTKRDLTLEDIERLQPFHWGYEFDEIIHQRNGFDVIITNPPWEIFKPQAKEFFDDYLSDIHVQKNKMTIKEFETLLNQELKNETTLNQWLNYNSQFPYVSEFFRKNPQFAYQSAIVNGKKTGTDINLYKLFSEQSYNLLKQNGLCGIVIPSGIYSDLGAKGLRDLLFSKTKITGLFCFENRKTIFENVDSRFKFVVLNFKKGLKTLNFPTAFMRHDVQDLLSFPNELSLKQSVDLIEKLSPDSLSIMEFKNPIDLSIAQKMLQFPMLGTPLENTWNLKLSNEFHMTNDSHVFKTTQEIGDFPLYEGKMIHQFEHQFSTPRYWVNEIAGRKAVLGRTTDENHILDYQKYRLAYRAIARGTDSRTLISTILPKNCFVGNSLNVSKHNDISYQINNLELLYVASIFNSFVLDYSLRQRVSANLNMPYIYQLPVPRLSAQDDYFMLLAYLSAKLICSDSAFDDLAYEVNAIINNPKIYVVVDGHIVVNVKERLEMNLKAIKDAFINNPEIYLGGDGSFGANEHFGAEKINTKNPPTEAERMHIRALIDAIVAKIYQLSEDEFKHVLNTFPIVDQQVKNLTFDVFKVISKNA